MNYRTKSINIIISGLLIAIGLIIPAIFHSAGIAGKVFLPMHIPVLLGGFLLPPIYALLVGMVTPIISSILTGMPPVFPMALIMMFELGIYGLAASFIFSMLAGRVMAGLVVYILSLAFGIKTLGEPIMFVKTGAVLAIPGILIQVVLIPVLMYAINKYTTINLD